MLRSSRPYRTRRACSQVHEIPKSWPDISKCLAGLDRQPSSSSFTSSRLANEMARTSMNSKYDSDEDSDWDRYSYGEDERHSSGGARSIGGRSVEGSRSGQVRRQVETSIFGLTDKRRPEPLRYPFPPPFFPEHLLSHGRRLEDAHVMPTWSVVLTRRLTPTWRDDLTLNSGRVKSQCLSLLHGVPASPGESMLFSSHDIFMQPMWQYR